MSDNITYRSTTEILADLGLTILPVRALLADAQYYQVLFFQPSGKIVGTTSSITNENHDEAVCKHNEFLKVASTSQTEIAVAPEYSCPWQALLESLQQGTAPVKGSLWIIGCESLDPNELARLKETYNGFTWWYEPVNEIAPDTFLDPVCFIFWARGTDGDKLMLLVQFKNKFSADRKNNLEHANMHAGTIRFRICNDDDSIQLVVLICSDALSFDWEKLHHPKSLPYLIFHLQLNPKPRHVDIRHYRERVLRTALENKEIVAINWGAGFIIPGTVSAYGGSTLYMKYAGLQVQDNIINDNHVRGLFYTYANELHTHVHSFPFSEGLYQYRATKLLQGDDVAVLAERSLPIMIEIREWNSSSHKWEQKDGQRDGFDEVLQLVGSSSAMPRFADLSPLDRERLVSLSNAEINLSKKDNWYYPPNIVYCRSSSDEIIRRTCLTIEPDTEALRQRVERLHKFAALHNRILADKNLFPKPIKDLAKGCTLTYPCPTSPNHNTLRADGQSGATIAFIGYGELSGARRLWDRIAVAIGDERDRLVIFWEDASNGTIDSYFYVQSGNVADDRTEEPRSFLRIYD